MNAARIIHANNDEALQSAAKFGYLGIVQFLIEYILKIEGVEAVKRMIRANRDNALTQAMYNGHYSVIDLLIKMSS